jgi:CRISPR-associated protein (TIGR02584 family)
MQSGPSFFPRRVLLAVTGLTPQVVTETLYALAVWSEPKFIPTEVHLVTTLEGAERARLGLLHERTGWFHRLRGEYGLPEIRFDMQTIHVLSDAAGTPLADIRVPADNERAADLITELVRRITDDPASALHVSIAGGRKTMGFYAGYALSLFGRPQDRLSHVLVSPPYESHPAFFYPTPESNGPS